MCKLGESNFKDFTYTNKIHEKQKAVKIVEHESIEFKEVDVIIIPGEMCTCDIAIHDEGVAYQIGITNSMLKQIKEAMVDG